LFTKQIPLQKEDFEPSLDISNFGLSSADLNTVFDAGKIVRCLPLTEIIAHLDAILHMLNICTKARDCSMDTRKWDRTTTCLTFH
jgi:hypothetical protein